MTPKGSVELLNDIGPEDSSQISANTLLSDILQEHIRKLQAQKDKLDRDVDIDKKSQFP